MGSPHHFALSCCRQISLPVARLRTSRPVQRLSPPTVKKMFRPAHTKSDVSTTGSELSRPTSRLQSNLSLTTLRVVIHESGVRPACVASYKNWGQSPVLQTDLGRCSAARVPHPDEARRTTTVTAARTRAVTSHPDSSHLCSRGPTVA